MGSFIALYVKTAKAGADLLKQISALFPDAGLEQSEGFLAVMVSDSFDAPEAEFTRISGKFDTDLFWLCFQSTVDAFEYIHWSRGKLVRLLSYGCRTEERTWERIEGVPEPWEIQVFFSPEELTNELKWTEAAPERVKVQNIWDRRILDVGSEIPRLESREAARQVAEHYQFPGW